MSSHPLVGQIFVAYDTEGHPWNWDPNIGENGAYRQHAQSEFSVAWITTAEESARIIRKGLSYASANVLTYHVQHRHFVNARPYEKPQPWRLRARKALRRNLTPYYNKPWYNQFCGQTILSDPEFFDEVREWVSEFDEEHPHAQLILHAGQNDDVKLRDAYGVNMPNSWSPGYIYPQDIYLPII